MATLKKINAIETDDPVLQAIALNIQIVYENQIVLNSEAGK